MPHATRRSTRADGVEPSFQHNLTPRPFAAADRAGERRHPLARHAVAQLNSRADGGSRRVRGPVGARAGGRIECHRQPAPGRPSPGIRRSDPRRPPRRRELRRRGDSAHPASFAAARSPLARPPEARRALPWTADSVVENTTFGSDFRSRPTGASTGRAAGPGQRSPSTASSRTAVVPAGGRQCLVGSSVTKWKTSSSGVVQSKSPAGPAP